VDLRDELAVRRDLDGRALGERLDLVRRLRGLREQHAAEDRRDRLVEVTIAARERAVVAGELVLGDEEPVRVMEARAGRQLDLIDEQRIAVVQRDLHAVRGDLFRRSDGVRAERQALRALPVVGATRGR
jgi:hypothetical protein